MKAVIDAETCIGCGVCPSVCPDVFVMNDDSGKAEVLSNASYDNCNLDEAIEACPVSAITKS